MSKAMLVILDGWGLGTRPDADAAAQADTPYFDSLLRERPHATLVTYGEQVGLPEGQMGNSEVGHLNIGAGRIVYQELARINKAVRERTLHANETLLDALRHARKEGKAVHLMGLVSDGGVHSHINHLLALIDICEQEGVSDTYIHAFMDGRDTDPRGGHGYLSTVIDHLDGKSARLASIIGRYYAMDRDNRWERIRKAYDLLVHGRGEAITDPLAAVQAHYDSDTTDEFLPAMTMVEGGTPVATIQPGDVVIFYNFRTDRPRQLTRALTQQPYPEQEMEPLDLRFVTMTKYDDTFEGIDVLFHKDELTDTLGEVVARSGKTQTRIAETEKYPHVTFFFNGGRETPFEGEHRILVPSPKVDTYDLQPEMSAYEVTDKIIDDLKTRQPDFVCLNYANPDMVGHTGVFEAAVAAAETVDQCLRKLMAVALELEYAAIIIADHGNLDVMVNEDGSPNTAHTTNLVPCILLQPDSHPARTLRSGKLGDIAPTLLALMDIEQPRAMTGEVLVEG